jgi:hypothetical protein
LCHFIGLLKIPSFYHDSLGTNIGKALKKSDAQPQGVDEGKESEEERQGQDTSRFQPDQ